MEKGDDCKSKISIWWDIHNCGVPTNVDPHFIAQNLSSALQQADLTGPIEINVFGDTKILDYVTQKALSDTGITLNHVPRGNKDAADKAILVAMLLWALDHPPPAHILLVSGDGDFANALHRLRLKRYNILLACPVIHVQPALLGAAKKVWYWKDLAKGQLVERESSQPTETTDEYFVLPNGGSKSSLSSSDKFQQKLGLGCSNGSVMHTQPPLVSTGFDSPQKMGQNMGDSVTAGPATSKGKDCTSSIFSQFENLCLQSEEKRHLTKDASRDCNQSVTDTVRDSRSQSYALSHEGRNGHHVKGDFNYNVSDTRIKQSGMNNTSVKVRANYGASVSSNDPHSAGSSHIVPNFIRPVMSSTGAQSGGSTVSSMGFGHPPHLMPRAPNYEDFREHLAVNMPSGNALNFKPPSPAIHDSHSPGRLMPKVPVKYAPPNLEAARPPLSKVSDPRAVVPQIHAAASSSLLTSNLGVLLHDPYLDMVYTAMKTLKHNMLPPTEANLLACIHYWNQQHGNFDLKQWLTSAVEQGKVIKTQIGRGLAMFFPPDKQGPWDCIDPGNMQVNYSHDVWNELRQFLLYGEQKQSFLSSQNGYEAAQILKNAPSSYIRDLVIGRILHVLQQAIQRKRWIKKGGTGWSPLSINEMALLDYSPNDIQGKGFRCYSSGHQEGFSKSFKSASPTNCNQTLGGLSKDAILEKLKSWLPELLKKDNEYMVSKLWKDFEQATGIQLDYRKLGFSSLQDFLTELADVARIETTRSGLLILCPAKKDVSKVQSLEPVTSRQSVSSDGLGDVAASVKENNAKLSRQIQVVKELESWLIRVLAIVQHGYDISKIHHSFLESTGIDLDKEGFDFKQLEGLLREFPEIIQIVNTPSGVFLAYPAGQNIAVMQMNGNIVSMGATHP